MKTYKYNVFFAGNNIGCGQISLVKGAHEIRIAHLVSKTWGPKKLGFSWTIEAL